jgi:hypothetical protein
VAAFRDEPVIGQRAATALMPFRVLAKQRLRKLPQRSGEFPRFDGAS